MPRNRKGSGIFDSYGLPKPIIGVVRTTAKTTASTGTSTRHLIEYSATPNQSSGQNGHTLRQSTLMPKLADGLAYNIPERPPSLQHISALKRTCKSMARYFEENSVTSLSPAGRVNSDEVYIKRKGNRVVFTEPIATYRSNGTGKTFGIIRLKGEEVKFKAASGWGRREHDDSLRDNEFCSAVSFPGSVRAAIHVLVVKLDRRQCPFSSIQSGANLSILQQVLQFCNYLGFKLRRNCWDKTEIGRYAACHVEKKLILMLVLDLIYDAETGDIAMYRLEELWKLRPPLRAQIYIDKDPCEGCRNFASILRDSTGIEFEIIAAKTFVEAEWVKVDGKKQLRGKHTAQNGQSQITKYSMSKTNRSEKTVDDSIPEASPSRKSKSEGKRKRLLDDYDDEYVDESSIFHSNDLQPKAKRSYSHSRTVDQVNKSKSNLFTLHSRRPTPIHNVQKDLASNTHLPSTKQRSTKVDMKSTKSSLPLNSTKHVKVPPPRGTVVDHYSTSVKSGRLHGHAVPSERSRAIAEFQQAKSSLLSKPVDRNLPSNRNMPSISSPAGTYIYTASDDLDSMSLRSSRTASPERPADVLPTPEITPPTRHARGLSSNRLKAAEPFTPSRYAQSSRKRNLSKAATHSSSSSSKQVSSRSIDLTTPEPSPLLKIKNYQYTPPSKSSKHRSEKNATPIPFKLSNNLN
ncbi:uncharacterized protein Bfra_001767 [Botrytis fragariae]|uniref:Single-strand DNA deaminase toxin A-like C-terminal domain-containing protein n=1 Tax=Botrytis fragariae TaxID=1964551 RepID=A0A8H6B1I1_9HELO|nr:uncharacterized protein Bfra_001767 [Botrytis fragariae]KAF5877400.1 hypothetical protein Bfra_001767 [Botrytis fragariae]